MNRLDVSIYPPVPSIQQVLWRAGCPPDKAGEKITKQASDSIEKLKSVFSESWCGAVLLEPGERPGFLESLWPEKPLTVMAATLGMSIQTTLDNSGDLDRFMMDSAASVAVESYMKRLQFSLSDLLRMNPTKRIAPGYGAFPLFWQKEIIDMFPLSGITCSEAFMLFPVKSMTGVAGWIKREN